MAASSSSAHDPDTAAENERASAIMLMESFSETRNWLFALANDDPSDTEVAAMVQQVIAAEVKLLNLCKFSS